MNLLSSMLALWSAISAVGLTCAALIVLAELRSSKDASGEEPTLSVRQAQGTPSMPPGRGTAPSAEPCALPCGPLQRSGPG
jgi:hypothetical protein